MQIGPHVSIGPNAVIGQGVRIKNSILLPGVQIKVPRNVCAGSGERSRCGAYEFIRWLKEPRAFALNAPAGPRLRPQRRAGLELVGWRVGPRGRRRRRQHRPDVPAARPQAGHCDDSRRERLRRARGHHSQLRRAAAQGAQVEREERDYHVMPAMPHADELIARLFNCTLLQSLYSLLYTRRSSRRSPAPARRRRLLATPSQDRRRR